jgi:hypothetical protein
MSRIATNASAFPLVHGEIRRAVVRQFPYGLYFRVHKQTIRVRQFSRRRAVGNDDASLWELTSHLGRKARSIPRRG